MALNAAELIERAGQNTGLTNFGDAPLREGLEILCKALLSEARLTAKGVAAVEGSILHVLEQRLKIEDWYRRHPEIDNQKIVAPVFVTGLPRSGTTALGNYLAQDSNARSIRRWEGSTPTPPPEAETQYTDARIAETQRGIDRQEAAAPALKTMSRNNATDPHENWVILQHTFQSIHFAGPYRVPSYLAWTLTCDMAPAYRYLGRVLKLLQWRCPPRRWNLKNPPDMFFPAAIKAVFPDARLVCSFRDPIKTVPSIASLLYVRRGSSTEHVDKIELGKTELELRVEQAQRAMAYREAGGTFIDVYNQDLVRDPAGTIRAIYSALGLGFTPEFESRLGVRAQERPKGKGGEHVYTPDEFGLSANVIRQRFGQFTEFFDIPLES